jgi:hypothetical protein
MSTTEITAVREFKIGFDKAEIAEMRISATRWPERETVDDDSQGVPLATMQELARYWSTDYDWRKREARLNALPNFLTEIDGLDLHFIQVRSLHEDPLPLIVTHGWPGSIVGQLKIIEPLADPRRTAAARRMPCVSRSPRCRVTGSQASPPPPAGIRCASPAPGCC